MRKQESLSRRLARERAASEKRGREARAVAVSSADRPIENCGRRIGADVGRLLQGGGGMWRLMRSLALVACLSALCGCTSLLIAGCTGHEGSGRVPTDTSKPPM